MATDTAVKPENKTDNKTDNKSTEKVAKPKPNDTEKRAKFRQLAGNRVSKSLVAIKTVGSLANPTAYVYNLADVEFIRRNLVARVNEVCDRLADALKAGKAASKQTEFELPE